VSGTAAARSPSALAQVRAFLPQGLQLPRESWEARHRVVLAVLVAHALLLPLFGLLRGWGPAYAFGEGALLGLLAALAAVPRLGRRFRASVAALGCVTSSAVLTQFSGGYIEAHFHFFVVVALVSLYQDWVPFLLAIVYVAVDHGAIGTLAPDWVYNHPDAVRAPWTWAAIHAGFVLAECAALLGYWAIAERARARSELVLDSAGEPILGLGLDGRVTFANPAAARLLGAPADRLAGQPLGRWLPGWTPEAALRQPQPGEGLLAPEGRPAVPVEWVVTAAQRAGLPAGYVVTLQDVTRRRQAEEDRRRVTVLTEQDRFKTQLLNTASHELNTPIGVLRLQVHMLEPELERASPALRDGFRRVQRHVDRLADLVKDTLDVARLQSGRMPLDRADADLAALAEQVRESFADLAAQKGVALRCAPRPAAGAPDAVAAVDPGRVEQVLTNLVANALKFTPRGGAVELAAVGLEGAVRLEVRDNGPGIAPEHAGLLFKPFSQVPGTGAAQSGTGLGLFICKGIAEQHGGRIWFEPNPGGGAAFVVELPRKAPPEPAAPAPAPAQAVSAEAAPALTVSVRGPQAGAAPAGTQAPRLA
jgi:signal transduction histidine kinase